MKHQKLHKIAPIKELLKSGHKASRFKLLKCIKEFIYQLKNLDEELFEKIQSFLNNIGIGVCVES